MRVEAGKCPHSTLIFVDDVKQKFVLNADDETGVVEKIAVDVNGKPQVNVTKNGFVKETIRGKVRIVLPVEEKSTGT